MLRRSIALGLVVVAICTIAARLDVHGSAAHRQDTVAGEDAAGGSTRELRFAYDEMFDANRMY